MWSFCRTDVSGCLLLKPDEWLESCGLLCCCWRRIMIVLVIHIHSCWLILSLFTGSFGTRRSSIFSTVSSRTGWRSRRGLRWRRRRRSSLLFVLSVHYVLGIERFFKSSVVKVKMKIGSVYDDEESIALVKESKSPASAQVLQSKEDDEEVR